MDLLILALLGVAQAYEPGFETRWSPVAVVGPVRLGEADVVVVRAPAERLLRIRCQHRDTTGRRVELDLTGGTVATIERPLPDPVVTPQGVLLPPPGRGGTWWALDAVGCEVEQVAVGTAPDRLDLAEYRARRRGVPGLRTELGAIQAFADDPWLQATLAAAPDDATWWGRYVAARPVGGFVPLRRALPLQGTVTDTSGVLGDPPRAQRVDAATAWTVQGPAQVRVVGRVLGGPGQVCLTVDGAPPSCLATAPLDVARVDAGRLVSGPIEIDGQPLGNALSWDLFVPEGRHAFSVDHALVVHGWVIDVTALRTVTDLPTEAVVLGRPLDVLPADQRLVATPSRGELPTVLFVPGAWRIPEPDAVTWVRPEALAGAAWWMEDGRVPVLLDPSDGLCELTLPDGSRWATSTVGRLHTWLPPVGQLDPTRPPRFVGCTGWLRTQGMADVPRERRLGLPVAAVDVEDALELEWSAPHLPHVQLQVSAPAGTDIVHVTVRGSDGSTERFAIHPDPTAVGRDPQGRGWTSPVAVEVPAPGWRLRVETDGPALVRAVAPADGALGVVPPAPAPRHDIASATRALAAATEVGERVAALLARSQALGDAGLYREALADATLAEDLGADVEADRLRLGWLVETRAAWAPPGTWTPLSDGWVPDLPSLAEGELQRLADLAATGRAVEVARGLRDLTSPVPWWTSGARGQILTAEDSREAFYDVVRSGTPDPEHPAFATLRSWSTWSTVTGLRGTEGWRAAWPEDDHTAELRPLLLPDDDARALPLRAGDTLVLPPLPRGATAVLRCAARDPAAASGPCRLRHLDVDLHPGVQVDAAPYGAPVRFTLPPTTGATFLDLDAGGEVLADLSLSGLPPGLAALSEIRRLGGGEASLDVRGPTVIALEARRPEGPGALRVVVADETRTVLLDAAPVRVLVEVPPGTQRVRLLGPAGTQLRVQARVAGERTLEPLAHLPLLAALRHPIVPVTFEMPEPASEPTPPVRQPRRERPFTLIGEALLGLGGDALENPEAARVTPLRGSQGVTLAARIGGRSLWLEGGVNVLEQAAYSAMTDVHLTLENWWFGAPLDGWLLADGSIRTSLDDTATTAFRGTLQGGLAIRARRWMDVRLSADLGGATRTAGWSATSSVPSLVWSTYRDTHRLWVQPELQLRAYPTPWMRTRVWVRMITNPPGDAIVDDAVMAGLDLRFSAPSLYGLIGTGLQYRPVDVGRAVAYTTPTIYGTLRGTFWANRDLAAALRVDGDYNAHFQRVTFDVALELFWSGRRDLGDLRPLRTDARFSSTWRQPDRWTDP